MFQMIQFKEWQGQDLNLCFWDLSGFIKFYWGRGQRFSFFMKVNLLLLGRMVFLLFVNLQICVYFVFKLFVLDYNEVVIVFVVYDQINIFEGLFYVFLYLK